MASDSAPVTNIQRFSLDDGPGIRTVVFFKGCNLRCLWCHNPECLEAAPQLQFNPDQCAGCGACVGACPNGALTFEESRAVWSPARCGHCGACARGCPGEALTMVGEPRSLEDIVAVAVRDAHFYRKSGGGVTLSGGEPLLRPDFCSALASRFSAADISVTIDTAGLVPWSSFEKILPWTSLVLLDIKAATPELHARLTGVDNGPILANLDRLCRAGTPLWIRVPLAGGLNDGDAEIGAVVDLLRGRSNIEKVDLLPYHEYGMGKYAKLGLELPDVSLAAPDPARQTEITGAFAAAGFAVELH